MHRLSAILALACVVTVVSTGCWRDTAANRDAERERILQERAAQEERAIRRLLPTGAKPLNPKISRNR
jgi:hypothetical protein